MWDDDDDGWDNLFGGIVTEEQGGVPGVGVEAESGEVQFGNRSVGRGPGHTLHGGRCGRCR